MIQRYEYDEIKNITTVNNPNVQVFQIGKRSSDHRGAGCRTVQYKIKIHFSQFASYLDKSAYRNILVQPRSKSLIVTEITKYVSFELKPGHDIYVA